MNAVARIDVLEPARRPSASPFDVQQNGSPLRTGPALDAAAFSTLRRSAILEGCKWDPQVGDESTLAPFPVLLRRAEWARLTNWAESLTAETLAAETELLAKPKLLDALGLPRVVQAALRSDAPVTPGAARGMRFDFHSTPDGWRISEVNSDVPGGFTEASFFTALMARHFPAATLAGEPTTRWADAVARTASGSGVIALLAAPGYMEDQQIVAFLAARLRERGVTAHLANPTQIAWRDGLAHLETAWHRGPLDAVVRFYQAEWLARLPARYGWRHFFRGSRTPVANPGAAIISESKRFPIVWDRLETPLPTWRALLPETRDPREAPWRNDDSWLVKSALSNTGDDVGIRALATPHEWREARWGAGLQPGRWVAQRRFESLPVDTPHGPRHACVGVYTIDGRAAGAYVRLARRPLVDYSAVDAALLLQDDD